MNKTSESQIKASRNWEQNNRKKATVASYRRTARSFIKNHATKDDIAELKKLIREKEIKMIFMLSTDTVTEIHLGMALESKKSSYTYEGTKIINLKRFYDFIVKNAKSKNVVFEEYLKDLIEKTSEGHSGYELKSSETKSGHAEVIDFEYTYDYDEESDEISNEVITF